MTDITDEFNATKKEEISPFSIRFTKDERATLEEMAKGRSIGGLIRSRVFDKNIPIERTNSRDPIKDEAACSQLMGALGKSRIPNNINQIAKAINTGAFPASPQTEKLVYNACRDIAWMRHTLVKALGLREGNSPDDPQRH